MRFQVRIQVIARPAAGDHDDEGRALVEILDRAVARGAAAPVAVVVRPERTELIGLAALKRAGVHVPRFMGALTRSTSAGHGQPVAVGVMGTLAARRRGDADPGVPSAHVFLEWPDNGWWHHQQLLDADRHPVPDSATLRRAVDGDPLPQGLGRWWSWGRRTRAGLTLGPLVRPAPQAEQPLVH